MKIIYIADDGTKFDDEFECRDYEWKQKHPHLKYIRVYDKEGNELKNVFSTDTYKYSEKIIVPTDEAAKDLRDLGRYTGFCCYERITGIGVWVFDDNKENFVLSETEE